MNVDTIKLKVQELKEKERQLDIQQQANKSLFILYQNLANKTKDEVLSNQTLVLSELITTLNEKLETEEFSAILQALAEQRSTFDEFGRNVLDSLSNLISQAQALSQKKHFDQSKFNDTFNSGVADIVSIIEDSNEQPTRTTYQRNGPKGKVSRVIEYYEDYTIHYDWVYNSDAQLIDVRTTKK